jgi:hypothetical protein
LQPLFKTASTLVISLLLGMSSVSAIAYSTMLP